MRPVPRPNRPLLEIGAGAYIVRPDGRILFVEQERDGVRDWGCVGGGLERGESIEECCVREAFEETGLRVRIKRLLAIDQFRLGDEMKGVGFLFLTEPDPWPQDVVLPGMDGRTRFHDHRWCSRDEYRALDLSPAELCLKVWPTDVGPTMFRRMEYFEPGGGRPRLPA